LALLLISSSPTMAEELKNNHKTIIDDPLLHLLDQQLQGVHSSLLVCKWPVALMSCFFVTLLCWDMAGDKGGWSQALWVPIVGVAMVLAIWVWDRLWIPGSHGTACHRFSLPHDHHPSSTSTLRPGTGNSLEFVRSSLHQSADPVHNAV
jgi:hypothetical protein